MTYDTFLEEMAAQFPNLREGCAEYMDKDGPLNYFGLACVLVPWLQTCLQQNDTANIAKICDFLEKTSSAAQEDRSLYDLVGIEIGEWLPEAADIQLLLSYLGPETKRVCSYDIGRLKDAPR